MKLWHYVISEYCNMRCTYCDVDVDNRTKQSNDKFDKFYNTHIVPDDEEYDFDIFGGEPLLQIAEVKYIIQILSNDPFCRKINITTNGTIYNEDVAKIASNKKVNLTVSYDGIHQLKNRGPKKLYLQELSEAGVTKAHTMLVGSQFDVPSNYLVRNHRHIEAKGFTPNMTLVRDVGTWNEIQSLNFLQDFASYIQFLIPRVNDNYYTFDNLPGLIKTYLNAILEFKIKQNAKTNCRCGDTYNAVLPTGTILPCERFARDLETYNKFVDVEKREKIMSECITCEIRDVCHKGCIYEQLKNNAPISELCAIYKGIVRELKILLQSTNHKLMIEFTKENL